jgi:hypothetical protein
VQIESKQQLKAKCPAFFSLLSPTVAITGPIGKLSGGDQAVHGSTGGTLILSLTDERANLEIHCPKQH